MADLEHWADSDSDAAMAERLVRVHCPIAWPGANRCLNCHGLFPCRSYEWGFAVLSDAGWSEDQILKLDTRTGPWS